jgi:hypothetical protein
MADHKELFTPRQPQRYQFNAIPEHSKGFAAIRIPDLPTEADEPIVRGSKPNPNS